MWEGEEKVLNGCTIYPKDDYGLVVEILDGSTVIKKYRVKLGKEGFWKYISINFSYKPCEKISIVLKCQVQSLTIDNYAINEIDSQGGITIGAM